MSKITIISRDNRNSNEPEITLKVKSGRERNIDVLFDSEILSNTFDIQLVRILSAMYPNLSYDNAFELVNAAMEEGDEIRASAERRFKALFANVPDQLLADYYNEDGESFVGMLIGARLGEQLTNTLNIVAREIGEREASRWRTDQPANG